MSSLQGLIGFHLDDPELAWSGAEEAGALADGRGHAGVESLAWIYPCWARACRGEVDEGIRDVERGFSLAEDYGHRWADDFIAGAHVCRMAGRRERADELLDRATAEYRRTEQ